VYSELNVFEVLNFDEISDEEGEYVCCDAAQESKLRESKNETKLSSSPSDMNNNHQTTKSVKEVRK